MTVYNFHAIILSMKINKAFKFRIYPDDTQKQFLAQSFGCARFVYNRFLRQRIDYYAENAKGLTYHNNALALTQLKKLPEFESFVYFHT